MTLRLRQDSDSSDEDIGDTQDTQAAGRTQKGKGKSTTKEGQYVSEEKADKRGKKPALLFSAEKEQKLVDFLHDNEILYNKHLKDYKDRLNREAVWDQFCEENNLDKDACQRWFQSQRTLFSKVTHMKSVLGKPQLTERQKWTRDNFDILRDHIMRHLKGKSEFRAPEGSASQASAAERAQHPDGRLCTWNRSRILLVQNPLVTQQICRTLIHISLLLDRVASV